MEMPRSSLYREARRSFLYDWPARITRTTRLHGTTNTQFRYLVPTDWNYCTSLNFQISGLCVDLPDRLWVVCNCPARPEPLRHDSDTVGVIYNTPMSGPGPQRYTQPSSSSNHACHVCPRSSLLDLMFDGGRKRQSAHGGSWLRNPPSDLIRCAIAQQTRQNPSQCN